MDGKPIQGSQGTLWALRFSIQSHPCKMIPSWPNGFGMVVGIWWTWFDLVDIPTSIDHMTQTSIILCFSHEGLGWKRAYYTFYHPLPPKKKNPSWSQPIARIVALVPKATAPEMTLPKTICLNLCSGIDVVISRINFPIWCPSKYIL